LEGPCTVKESSAAPNFHSEPTTAQRNESSGHGAHYTQC
jgi:hypothetical protein